MTRYHISNCTIDVFHVIIGNLILSQAFLLLLRDELLPCSVLP